MDISEYAHTLHGKTVLISGAGGGIGLEAAQNFAIMGAKVLILEIDAAKGESAQQQINGCCPDSTVFYQIDLADEEAIETLTAEIRRKYGCPDIIFHNAAVLPLGPVGQVSSKEWDLGYRVNFKGPLLLSSCFLDEMRQRNSGTIVFVSSSGAAAGMGAYEIFKTAQVELSSTLSMELEGTGVNVYAIGPGLVKTQTAMASIEVVAKGMGISTDAFYEMNSAHIISVQEAALGFACSVLRAEEFNGREIGAIQVLHAMERSRGEGTCHVCAPEALEKVCATFESQYRGWKERNVFERQWVMRDFKKTVGKSADEVYEAMQSIRSANGKLAEEDVLLLKQLAVYWKHQYDLLQGFERNPEKLREHSAVIREWIADIERCIQQ